MNVPFHGQGSNSPRIRDDDHLSKRTSSDISRVHALPGTDLSNGMNVNGYLRARTYRGQYLQISLGQMLCADPELFNSLDGQVCISSFDKSDEALHNTGDRGRYVKCGRELSISPSKYDECGDCAGLRIAHTSKQQRLDLASAPLKARQSVLAG